MPQRSGVDQPSQAIADSVRPERRRRLIAAALILMLSLLTLTAGVVFRRWIGPTADGAPNPRPVSVEPASIKVPRAPAERSVDQLRSQSEREMRQLIEHFPQSPGALHIAGSYFAQVQQYSEAAEIWERCVALAPDYAGPRVGLASAAMERGEDQEAVEILQAALADGCSSPELFEKLATALQKTGQLEDAELIAQQGLVVYPEHAKLWLAFGQIQLQLNKFKEARGSLLETVRLWPDSATAHFALATASARLGDDEQAATHRARYTELTSASGEDRFHVVYAETLRDIVVATLTDAAAEYLRQSMPQEAERLYLEALALDPDRAGTYRLLASFYHSRGKLANAQLLQRHLVTLEPDAVENWLNLASLSIQVGLEQTAEEALREAIRRAPDGSVAHIALSSLYLQQGRNRKAREAARQAIQREPSVQAYLLIAAASQELDDGAAAVQAVLAAQRLSPDDPRVQQAIAEMTNQ